MTSLPGARSVHWPRTVVFSIGAALSQRITSSQHRMTASDHDPLTARGRARIGTLLENKWRIDSLLGVGGMAIVYAATHRNQNKVAIKILHPDLAQRPDLAERFAREGYVANTVSHPGVVKVLDDGTTPDGAPFLVMELLEGENLEVRCQRRSEVMSPSETLAVAEQLLDVLVAAHRAGVIHRDIKPDNLFLTTEGRLKVLDFGVARLAEGSREGSHGTRSGSVLGTPPFMAPEQARGRWHEVDERTDIWAVGATLFTLASGFLVHDAETPNEQLILAATERAVPLRQRVADVPDELAHIVDRALESDKAARWPSAAEMLAHVRALAPSIGPDSRATLPRASHVALHDVATLVADTTAPGQSVTAAASTRRGSTEAPRTKLGSWLAAAAALAAVAVAGLFVARSEPELPPSTPSSARVEKSPPAPALAPRPRAALTATTASGAPAAAADAGVERKAAPQASPRHTPRPIRPRATGRDEDEALYERRR